MRLSLLCLGLLFACSTSIYAQKNPVVQMETNHGTIKIELYPDKAPETVKNFLNYVEKKHYDGLIFHRVMPNFMIQGGGFTQGMKEKTTGAPIKNEAGNLSNLRGTIAMARTGAPHSATSQFFINVKDNKALDKENSRDGWGYCAFGKVIEGMDTVDKIKGVTTGSFGVHDDVPKEDVVIKSAKRIQ